MRRRGGTVRSSRSAAIKARTSDRTASRCALPVARPRTQARHERELVRQVAALQPWRTGVHQRATQGGQRGPLGLQPRSQLIDLPLGDVEVGADRRRRSVGRSLHAEADRGQAFGDQRARLLARLALRAAAVQSRRRAPAVALGGRAAAAPVAASPRECCSTTRMRSIVSSCSRSSICIAECTRTAVLVLAPERRDFVGLRALECTAAQRDDLERPRTGQLASPRRRPGFDSETVYVPGAASKPAGGRPTAAGAARPARRALRRRVAQVPGDAVESLLRRPRDAAHDVPLASLTVNQTRGSGSRALGLDGVPARERGAVVLLPRASFSAFLPRGLGGLQLVLQVVGEHRTERRVGGDEVGGALDRRRPARPRRAAGSTTTPCASGTAWPPARAARPTPRAAAL